MGQVYHNLICYINAAQLTKDECVRKATAQCITLFEMNNIHIIKMRVQFVTMKSVKMNKWKNGMY